MQLHKLRFPFIFSSDQNQARSRFTMVCCTLIYQNRCCSCFLCSTDQDIIHQNSDGMHNSNQIFLFIHVIFSSDQNHAGQAFTMLWYSDLPFQVLQLFLMLHRSRYRRSILPDSMSNVVFIQVISPQTWLFQVPLLS